MRHIFVINPKAGRVDRTPEISAKLHSYDGKIDYEIYVTQSLGDAQGYVREYLQTTTRKRPTASMPAAGMARFMMSSMAPMALLTPRWPVLALGSGNDFVKNFHDLEAFRHRP
jgi:hypothetical protein